MKTIEQENVQASPRSLSDLRKLRLTETNSFFDDYSFSSSFSMNRNSNSGYGSSKGLESLLAESRENKESSWVIVNDPVSSEKPKDSYTKAGKLFTFVLSFFEILKKFQLNFNSR